MIAALWTDLSLTAGDGNGRVCVSSVPEGPWTEGRWTVTFDGVGYFGATEGSSTFQIELGVDDLRGDSSSVWASTSLPACP